MTWRFRSARPSIAEVEIHWTTPGNFPGRLERFRGAATGATAFDIYARATFIKYRALVEDFAVFAKDQADWEKHRRDGSECFAFLEASLPAYDETAGTLLLRSAWNGDAIVDLLGTNPRAADHVQGAGIMLAAAAARIASQSGAKLIFVETARQSTGYWEKFLKQGTELIRSDGSDVAFERATAILRGGNLTYAEHDDR